MGDATNRLTASTLIKGFNAAHGGSAREQRCTLPIYAVPSPCGGSRDRRRPAKTTRDFRCRLGSREPETAPLGYVSYLGAVSETGACNIPRSLGRASALRFRDEALSVASCGLRALARGPVAGAERSPHAPAPWGSDTGSRLRLRLSACAGRLQEWNDPRPRQPPEDWKPVTRLPLLPPIPSTGSAETSSRPGLHNVIAVARNRRQDRPPSGRRRLGLDGGEHDGNLRHVGIGAG